MYIINLNNGSNIIQILHQEVIHMEDQTMILTFDDFQSDNVETSEIISGDAVKQFNERIHKILHI